MRKEFTYPAKKVERAGGDFTVKQFILPVEIRGEALWALLDTGANVSILPQELASDVLGLRTNQAAHGRYDLAGLVSVPYETHSLNVKILEYIQNTIPELRISDYDAGPTRTAVHLRNVEFQTPIFTWEEIAAHLTSTPPIALKSVNMRWVILGLYGVLEQLNISFVGDNSVSIQSYSRS